MQARAWQRPIKGGLVETYVCVDGERLHITADVEFVDEVLVMWEQLTGKVVPPLTRLKPRYGRRRRARKPIDGQLTIDDMLAAA